jgi:D-arabinose 1-dehydrogenase-like Zn-dependent alcohol dehydrogenase
MGGLGRTINGSYAEYTRVGASNVALIESDLPWAELAAIPETYATAWTCLFRNLEIAGGQTLVIRGAASAFGQAALNMAVNASVRVIATTRGRDASSCWNSLAQSASKRRDRSFRSGSLKPSSSMRFSILSATAPSSIPSPCCGGAAARASRVGWAASRRSRTSTRSYKWRAAFT